MTNNIFNSIISISKKYIYIVIFFALATPTCIADTLHLRSKGTAHFFVKINMSGGAAGESYYSSIASFHSLDKDLDIEQFGSGSGTVKCQVENGQAEIRALRGYNEGYCTFFVEVKDFSARDTVTLQLIRASAYPDTRVEFKFLSGYGSYVFLPGASYSIHDIVLSPSSDCIPQEWIAEYPATIDIDVDKSTEQQVLRVSGGNTSADVRVSLQIKNDSGGNISRAMYLEKDDTGGGCNTRFSDGEQCILKVRPDMLPVGKHEGVINITANLI